ncbi:MAG: F0F1 ATP synthase subunit epsilon [Rhodoplanes sp.]|jgi:F-type H+-transporting ATPase subunit epsilon|nr:F0F1 ATP synthase subunit epsilon [Rhodoplanes sp.]
MTTFHFELVSPERLMFSGEVTQVDVPGEEGDFGVLAGHAPMVATIRPGVLTIHSDQTAPVMIVVRGGFAEVSASGVTVLAQEVVPVDEIEPDTIHQAIKDAEEDVADAKTDADRNRAAARLDHLKTLKDALGH